MEGTITPAQVLEQTAQRFEAEESDALFDALVCAIHAGATYANVHSALLTLGEICSQSLVAMMISLQMGRMRERLQ